MNKIQRWWSGLTASLWFVPAVAHCDEGALHA